MATATTTTTATTMLQSTASQITASNVQQLFPEVDRSLLSSGHKSTANGDLQGYDEEQIRLMDEACIVLDTEDQPIGSASKKTCHLMTNINQGLLHRAFSVFLFNSKNELLLQQRATEKITFPDMWTNTCCSHPLAVAGEMGEDLVSAAEGAKRAAQRKLFHELNIVKEQVPLDKFDFLTRIHYLAPSDGKWGEHEVDYILFIKANVHHSPNPNEVRDSRYVSAEELKAMFADTSLKFTPWFKLICQKLLFEWWSHLDNGIEKYVNDQKLHRM